LIEIRKISFEVINMKPLYSIQILICTLTIMIQNVHLRGYIDHTISMPLYIGAFIITGINLWLELPRSQLK